MDWVVGRRVRGEIARMSRSSMEVGSPSRAWSIRTFRFQASDPPPLRDRHPSAPAQSERMPSLAQAQLRLGEGVAWQVGSDQTARVWSGLAMGGGKWRDVLDCSSIWAVSGQYLGSRPQWTRGRRIPYHWEAPLAELGGGYTAGLPYHGQITCIYRISVSSARRTHVVSNCSDAWMASLAAEV